MIPIVFVADIAKAHILTNDNLWRPIQNAIDFNSDTTDLVNLFDGITPADDFSDEDFKNWIDEEIDKIHRRTGMHIRPIFFNDAAKRIQANSRWRDE